ncbi:hypothetical protein F4X86_02120 [Candidatus Saccharibacteria bacterium]|nr:hypothetical protein [Candidatus Saccharibacteria bacterium]
MSRAETPPAINQATLFICAATSSWDTGAAVLPQNNLVSSAGTPRAIGLELLSDFFKDTTLPLEISPTITNRQIVCRLCKGQIETTLA